MKEENVTMDGEVVAVHRGSLRVVLANGGVVSATIAGRMMGDKVLVEMTPYDLTKGRIVYRSR